MSEVVDLRTDEHNLFVIVQHPSGKREQFGFPLGEKWEEENENGELNAIQHVRYVLSKRKTQIENSPAHQTIDSLKEKHTGKKLR